MRVVGAFMAFNFDMYDVTSRLDITDLNK